MSVRCPPLRYFMPWNYVGSVAEGSLLAPSNLAEPVHCLLMQLPAFGLGPRNVATLPAPSAMKFRHQTCNRPLRQKLLYVFGSCFLLSEAFLLRSFHKLQEMYFLGPTPFGLVGLVSPCWDMLER